jgi:hypothetical protein
VANLKDNALPVIFGGFSVLLGVIYSLFSYFKGDPQNGFTAVTYGLVLSILLSCMGLMFTAISSTRDLKTFVGNKSREIVDKNALKEVKDILQKTRHELTHVRLNLTTGQLGLENHSRLQRLHPLIREAGEYTLNDYMNNFEVSSHGFEIAGQTWSLLSYKYFWQVLVNEQRNNKEPDNPYVVRITHSNSIDIWGRNSPEVIDLLQKQKEFCAAGGKIARIFISEREEPPKTYQDVIQKMEAHSIKAFYFYMPVNMLDYDFLWVDRLNFVVTWTSGAGGGLLSRCEISQAPEHEVNNLKNQWNSLWGQLTERLDFDPEVKKIFSLS